MQIAKSFSDPTTVKLIITATPAELESVKKHVLGHFAGQVKVPGFRAGKAPLEMLEKSIDPNALSNEFLEHAMNSLYRKAMEHEKLRPVAQPQVQIKKFVPFTELEFEVETEVIGNVKLPDYKKIKVAKPPATVTAKDVDEVLESLRTRSARREDIDRPAKLGDEVVIDFTGKNAKGRPIAGGDGKDYPLILGSEQFVPGFERELVGVQAGDKRQFDLTFPADYGVSTLRGQKTRFEVSVKKVSELAKPKLDNEFAAQAGPFKTLAELKSDIKKQLKQERQQAADRSFENEVVRAVVAGAHVDIPKVMVDEQVLAQEEDEKRNLVYRGQTWQEHLTQEGITEEQHRERHRPEAEERVKAGLVLSEIAAQERIEVKPNEVAGRIHALKAQYQDPGMQAELDKPEARQDIANRLLSEKTIAKLVSYSSKGNT